VAGHDVLGAADVGGVGAAAPTPCTLPGVGAAGLHGPGMAGGHKGLGADGLHGLGVDASQQGLGAAGGQHGPGDMAGTGAASASGGSRRGNKKSRDDEVYFSSI